jgi:tetratricopeptide (TPR) repeat protein
MASARHELAGVEADLGELDTAIADYKRVIATFTRISGADSLDATRGRLNLGLTYTQKKDWAAALSELSTAVPLAEKHLGEHPAVAQGLIGVATAELALKHAALAERALSHAEKILSGGSAPLDLAEAEVLHARARLALGDRPRAVELAASARRLLRANPGPRSIEREAEIDKLVGERN